MIDSGKIPLRSLIFRKEVRVAALIGALLIIVPALIQFNGRTARLARTILNGHDANAEKLLARYPGLLDKGDNENGFTPLHWAVIADRTNLVMWLVNKGAAVNATDPSGMTPLHMAAIFNRLSCAEILIAHGANMNAMGRKYGALRLAPIHLAAEEGHTNMVQCLLRHGVNVDTPSEGANRLTPLHMASGKGRLAVVQMLLDAGADINAGDLVRKTPLTWAIESGQRDTADLLRSAGALP
jgi:ankyrin repeat protein